MVEKEKEVKTKSFKVIKEFTYDKLYRVGSQISLSDKEAIQALTNNKFIK
jgi:hypothetical protein